MSDKAQNVSYTIMTVHQHDVGSIKTEYNYSCPCTAILVRGGPFDMWGGLVFPSRSNFFSTPSVQFFQTLSKANNFFLGSKTQNNFFHHLFHLILHTPC